MKDLVIRKAKLKELKIVQDLNHELFIHDKKFDKTLDQNWSYKEGKNYFKKAIEEDHALCLVAEHEGEIVGYLAAFIYRFESYLKIRRAEIENMFVIKAFRGKGVGSELVKEYFKWCKDKNIKIGRVATFDRNTSALGFYGKMGFKIKGIKLEKNIS
ncbi:GNAT family N-acetyltransferase [Candidatus Woesebacteria bacterium]|nr:GNAT family N-acetyltransferase [Candidatus Woesebacteria bacterium]